MHRHLVNPLWPSWGTLTQAKGVSCTVGNNYSDTEGYWKVSLLRNSRLVYSGSESKVLASSLQTHASGRTKAKHPVVSCCLFLTVPCYSGCYRKGGDNPVICTDTWFAGPWATLDPTTTWQQQTLLLREEKNKKQNQRPKIQLSCQPWVHNPGNLLIPFKTRSLASAGASQDNTKVSICLLIYTAPIIR